MEGVDFTDIPITPTFIDMETVGETIQEDRNQIDLESDSLDELYKTDTASANST